MREYWQGMSDRDRWAVIIAVLAFIGYLSYQLIFSPLARKVEEKTQVIADKQTTLLWMEQIQPKIHQSGSMQHINNGQLLTILSTQLNTSTFKNFNYHLEQTSSGEIQLEYDAVPYNPFMQWFWQFSHRYSIKIKQLTLHKTKRSGVVRLSISLTTDI